MLRSALARKAVAPVVLTTSAVAWLLLATRADSWISTMPMQGAQQGTFSTELSWIEMVTAMMLPSVLAPIAHVADRSLARRRWKGITLFLIAYVIAWLPLGIVASYVMDAVDSWLWVAIAFAFALVWQCSPLKQRCLNRCHALPPIGTAGWAADANVVGFGLRYGLWCIGSCAPFMIAVMALPSSRLAGMWAAAAWLFAEKLERPKSTRWGFHAPAKACRIAFYHVRQLLAKVRHSCPLFWECEPRYA